jgi:hypothetical protein
MDSPADRDLFAHWVKWIVVGILVLSALQVLLMGPARHEEFKEAHDDAIDLRA